MDGVQAPAAPQIKKGDIKPQPRGIYTTVPKAGSYGTKGVTLSEHKGAGGVVRTLSSCAAQHLLSMLPSAQSGRFLH